jgi:hypothetical protein
MSKVNLIVTILLRAQLHSIYEALSVSFDEVAVETGERKGFGAAARGCRRPHLVKTTSL